VRYDWMGWDGMGCDAMNGLVDRAHLLLWQSRVYDIFLFVLK
jgi:hypothetical protein